MKGKKHQPEQIIRKLHESATSIDFTYFANGCYTRGRKRLTSTAVCSPIGKTGSWTCSGTNTNATRSNRASMSAVSKQRTSFARQTTFASSGSWR